MHACMERLVVGGGSGGCVVHKAATLYSNKTASCPSFCSAPRLGCCAASSFVQSLPCLAAQFSSSQPRQYRAAAIYYFIRKYYFCAGLEKQTENSLQSSRPSCSIASLQLETSSDQTWVKGESRSSCTKGATELYDGSNSK